MQLQLFLKGQQSYGFTEKRGKQWLGAWLGCIGLDRVFCDFRVCRVHSKGVNAREREIGTLR